jgi:hypothetical protein
VSVHIKNTIKSNLSVIRKAILEQFEKLVFEPLSGIAPVVSPTSGIVIVVDTPGESGHDNNIKLIFNLPFQC